MYNLENVVAAYSKAHNKSYLRSGTLTSSMYSMGGEKSEFHPSRPGAKVEADPMVSWDMSVAHIE